MHHLPGAASQHCIRPWEHFTHVYMHRMRLRIVEPQDRKICFLSNVPTVMLATNTGICGLLRFVTCALRWYMAAVEKNTHIYTHLVTHIHTCEHKCNTCVSKHFQHVQDCLDFDKWVHFWQLFAKHGSIFGKYLLKMDTFLRIQNLKLKMASPKARRIYIYIYIYTHLLIRRAFGPRHGEIRENNPLSFNPLRGLPPPIILPQGGPGAKSCCIVE